MNHVRIVCRLLFSIAFITAGWYVCRPDLTTTPHPQRVRGMSFRKGFLSTWPSTDHAFELLDSSLAHLHNGSSFYVPQCVSTRLSPHQHGSSDIPGTTRFFLVLSASHHCFNSETGGKNGRKPHVQTHSGKQSDDVQDRWRGRRGTARQPVKLCWDGSNANFLPKIVLASRQPPAAYPHSIFFSLQRQPLTTAPPPPQAAVVK